MKVHVRDLIKLVALRLYVDDLITASLGSEGPMLSISSFVELAISVIDKPGDEPTNFKDVITKLQSILSRSFVAELPTTWPRITEASHLSVSDGIISLDITDLSNEKIYRRLSKLLTCPVSYTIPSSNVDTSLDNTFSITFTGMKESDVVTNLIKVCVAAYNKTIFYDANNQETLSVVNNKKPFLSIMNVPKLQPNKSVICDVTNLLPTAVRALAEWVLSSNDRVILIGTKYNVCQLNAKFYEGLGVEAYYVSAKKS